MRSYRLRPILRLLLALGTLCTSPVLADNFSISLEGQYSRRLSGNPGHDNAIGGSLLFEWQPIREISLGAGFGLNSYFGVSATTLDPSMASSIDLLGRLAPWGVAQGFSPYLIGGAGFNPKVGNNAWPGNWHAMVGAGTWCSLSPRMALDLSATYDLFTPLDASLQNVNLRVGFTFFTEDLAPAVRPQAAPRALVAPISKPTQEMGARTPALHRKMKKPARKVQANSLWDLAARPDIYGDPELYPILVDANFSNLTTPNVIGSIPLVPGTKLTIPRKLTAENLKIARENAWKETYTRWRGKNVTREEYLRWKAAMPKGDYVPASPTKKK